MTDEIYCTRCGEKLIAAKAVYLELDQRYGEYCPEGAVPPEYSQGGFPFGRACANRARQKHDLRQLRQCICLTNPLLDPNPCCPVHSVPQVKPAFTAIKGTEHVR